MILKRCRVTGTIDLPFAGFADQADVFAVNVIKSLPFY